MKSRITLILALVLACHTVWSQVATESGKIVKVLSFNIYHGATMKGDYNLEAIAKIITDENPDLVALQEVDFKTGRAKGKDLATELGWRTHLAPLFAKAMSFDGGEYGVALLSRYSFVHTRRFALPNMPEREPRVVLEAAVVLPSDDTVTFVGTHLDHLSNDSVRVAQAKKINEVYADSKYPTILAGDFNAIPGSRPINLLEEMWAPTYDRNNIEPTCPSSNPKDKIDYVMVYPKSRWRVIGIKVIHDTVASDHFAYLVTLELVK
jgi:Metal-dependent hydrolase